MQNLKMLAEDEREVSISRELHHLTISIKLEFVLLLFSGGLSATIKTEMVNLEGVFSHCFLFLHFNCFLRSFLRPVKRISLVYKYTIIYS